MLEKIKKLFKIKHKDYVSHIKFREAVKALAMETYRDITILYLVNIRGENVYHFFHKKDFYDGVADTDNPTLDGLQELAHSKVDSLK